MPPQDEYSPLFRQMRLITVAGSLAMVYVTCVGCPVATDYLRQLGATDLQFGLLGGVPLIMLTMQFFGAWLANKLRRRKGWFMTLCISARLLDLPVACLPLCFPNVLGPTWIPIFIVLASLNGAMANLITPLWFSWMSDLIPRRILNRYWGARHRIMTFVWTAAYLGVAAFTWYAPALDVRVAYAALVAIGVTAGVVDIILFTWIEEPENVILTGRGPLETFLEPLRHREYRSLVRYGSAFLASAMLGAAFMQLYVIKVVGVPIWQANVIWCAAGLGSAVVARFWGHVADRYGHRPVLILCTFCKPYICLVFLFLTRENAFVLLPIAFFLDGTVNAAHAIAMNGFMLKMAPRENRSMFIAAITALTGLAGGVGSILGGCFLRATEETSYHLAGHEWSNYHLLFMVSFVLRVLCIPLSFAVREPASKPPAEVLSYIMGQWPYRVLLFPVGLYRRLRPEDENLPPDDGTDPGTSK